MSELGLGETKWGGGDEKTWVVTTSEGPTVPPPPLLLNTRPGHRLMPGDAASIHGDARILRVFINRIRYR